MHAGKYYKLIDVITWTRRDIYKHIIFASVATILFYMGATFLALSWVPIALLGTAVALIVGFKNNATYGRLWEARQIYGSIINTSRAFSVMVKDFYGKELKEEIRVVFLRHIAWLTALRYQLRSPRIWENLNEIENIEFSNKYKIPERVVPVQDALKDYLIAEELNFVLSQSNPATQVMSLQSTALNKMYSQKKINDFQLMQLQAMITTFYDHQGRVERIKNFPYPRNLSTISTLLLDVFVLFVPFGLLKDLNSLGNESILEGYSLWLNIPFSALLCWVFTSLDKVGDSSSNPFEGGANDVPITQISRLIEIDMKEMILDSNIPKPILPTNEILL